MSQMSDYLEGQIRAHIFRTASFTKPSVIAIALCTSAPTDASTGATIAEVSGGSYARVTRNPSDSNWSAPDATGGLTDNVAAITFPQATANWGTITHVAILDNATLGAGNVLFWGALSVSKVVNSGDTFSFDIGALDIVFA